MADLPFLPKFLHSYIFVRISGSVRIHKFSFENLYHLLLRKLPVNCYKITIRRFLLCCFFFTFPTVPVMLFPFRSVSWRSRTAMRNWFLKRKWKVFPVCKPGAEQDNKKRTQQTINKQSVLFWLDHSCNHFCILFRMLIGIVCE